MIRTKTTLGEICKMYQPKTISSKKMVNKGAYPVFGANGIIGRYDQYNHKEPQLIIGCRGSCGSVNISEPFSWINGNAMVIQPPLEKISLRYMEYLFRGGIDLSKAITGAAQPQITRKSLEEISFSYPQIEEQELIVNKIDYCFSEIDKSLEKIDQIEKNTSDIFEKSLNEISKLKGSIVSLKDVCEIKAKLINPKVSPYCDQYHIGAGNMRSLSNKLNNVLTAEEEGLISSKFTFDTDSVLYSKIRPYLRKVHLPNFKGICSADIYPLVSDPLKLNREYLYYLLLSKNFTDYAMAGSARSGMPKVNRKHLFDYYFTLPSIQDQIEYVNKTKRTIDNIDLLKKDYFKKRFEFKKLKSSILKRELQI